MTCFREMTAEDLGTDASDNDLHAFQRACEIRQTETGESDEAVTDWMWGDGDYLNRVEHYRTD